MSARAVTLTDGDGSLPGGLIEVFLLPFFKCSKQVLSWAKKRKADLLVGNVFPDPQEIIFFQNG
jgi:hypothetical protein